MYSTSIFTFLMTNIILHLLVSLYIYMHKLINYVIKFLLIYYLLSLSDKEFVVVVMYEMIPAIEYCD